MDIGDELRVAVGDLETTLRLSRRLDRGFNDHRMEAIQQRREISAKLARLSSAAQAISDGSDRSTFLNQFSKMRSALALHQATWPIVAVDQSDPAYRTSIQTARAAYFKFFEWVRLQ